MTNVEPVDFTRMYLDLLIQQGLDNGNRIAELTEGVKTLVKKQDEMLQDHDRLWKLYESNERNITMHEKRLDAHDNRLHRFDGERGE